MSDQHKRAIREAFRMPTPISVRIAVDHFLVDGDAVPVLTGRLLRTQFLRKLVQHGALACYAPDGAESTEGVYCDDCRHPRCRPYLRLYLDRGAVHLVLDLGPASARNLLALEDDLVADGLHLEHCPLRLTVTPRGSWGEVRFQRFP